MDPLGTECLALPALGQLMPCPIHRQDVPLRRFTCSCSAYLELACFGWTVWGRIQDFSVQALRLAGFLGASCKIPQIARPSKTLHARQGTYIVAALLAAHSSHDCSHMARSVHRAKSLHLQTEESSLQNLQSWLTSDATNYLWKLACMKRLLNKYGEISSRDLYCNPNQKKETCCTAILGQSPCGDLGSRSAFQGGVRGRLHPKTLDHVARQTSLRPLESSYLSEAPGTW